MSKQEKIIRLVQMIYSPIFNENYKDKLFLLDKARREDLDNIQCYLIEELEELINPE